MADFFQSLSAIGDTLANNRARNSRERTLADLGQHFGRATDYKALGAKLIALGDFKNGLAALRLGEARDAGPWLDDNLVPWSSRIPGANPAPQLLPPGLNRLGRRRPPRR